MVLTKDQKEKIIEELEEKIAKQKVIIFIDFTGLKVDILSQLRKKLRSADCELKVAKKTLMKIALEKAGIEVEPEKLRGEVALVFGYKDEILPAKIIYQFSQENPNLKILAGFFDNRFRLAEEIIALAQLPSREELLTRLIGSLSTPISGLINALQGNIKGLIYLLINLKTQMSNLKL